jgi:dipeptidyl aminopeptidase/acylaminoacyl peptidase
MQLLKIVMAGLICVAGAWGQTGVEQRRYETVFYPSGKLKIEAYVYKPEGAGPFPVIIYNHGSRVERDRISSDLFHKFLHIKPRSHQTQG